MNLPLPTGKQALYLLERFKEHNRFYQTKLRHLSTKHVDWQEVPFTTKSELLEDQAEHPPFGQIHGLPSADYVRLHQTSGSRGRPLRWLDTPASWQWMLNNWRLIFQLAEINSNDRLYFPFSFGPFLGFWTAFEGASKLGCFCVPGGGMTTLARLQMLLELKMTVICCTPTYALRMLEVGQAEGLPLQSSSVRALILAGEPGASIPSIRERIETGWNARVFDHYGMTEIGPLGMECLQNPGGFHLLASECIVEVIDTATQAPTPHGEEGELVLTNLGRWGSPLLRYRTGDRVIMDVELCSCGRHWPRVRGGVLGRTDDLILIRGNNVYPSMIEAIVMRFPMITEYRMIVEDAAGLTQLRIEIETATDAPSQITSDLADAIRNEYHFRPEVIRVSPGTLTKSEMKSSRLIRRINV